MSHGLPTFVHLHVHSSYSLGVGLSTPDEICAHAKRAGFEAVVLTDTNGTFGYVEFHQASRRHGVQPIYGAVIHHTSAVRPADERFELTLLALTTDGLANVAALASLSSAAAAHDIVPSIDQFTQYTKDVIVLAGATGSELAALVLAGDDAGAREALDRLTGLFGPNLYVSVQDYEHPVGKQLAHRMHGLAVDCGVKTVLAEEVRYVGEGMRHVHGLLEGVQHPNEEGDFFRIDELQTDRGMRNAAEMAARRSAFPEAYDNAGYIAASIDGDLFEAALDPSGWRGEFDVTAEDLHSRCLVRLEERLSAETPEQKARYRDILAAEVKQIATCQLVPAFMLHSHIIATLREKGLPLGPATGLNLQSLCAWLLGITSYDPYRYTAGFTPMLDRAARGMNEIEIQIPNELREEAVGVLAAADGDLSVAYVPAIERITAARAARMAGRVVDATEDELAEVQAIISRHPGESLKTLTEEQRQLSNLYRRSPAVRELLVRATHLEHLPCGFIRSKRSMALAFNPLSNMFGHIRDGDGQGVFVQTSRDVIPVEGILRIDFTPLHALTVEYHVTRLLGDELAGWSGVPVDDPQVWRQIQEGDPAGVFLFEGAVIQQQRESFRLSSLAELTDFLAVLRLRGDPRTVAQRFAAFQQAPIVAFVQPEEVKQIAASTNGHVLYNEQLRDLLCVLTGSTEPEGLRMLNELKAATPAGMSSVRRRYMTGAADRNIDPDLANYWFDRMLYYAHHAISRERVLADALIVYKLFYLKAREPGAFYTALLNTYVTNDSKMKKYIDHLSKKRLILGVDVNISAPDFVLEGNKIRAGLRSVAGFNLDKAAAVLKVRGRKGVKGVEDFALAADKHGLTRDDCRNLVRAGAFDFTGDSHKVLLARLSKVTKRGRKQAAKAVDTPQLELPFDA